MYHFVANFLLIQEKAIEVIFDFVCLRRYIQCKRTQFYPGYNICYPQFKGLRYVYCIFIKK